jgi:hypothetical protein
MIIRDPGTDRDQPIDAHLPDNAVASAVPTADAAVSDRQPKGDHNRRLALGMDVDEFALEAGVTADELREYEQTWPDHEFSLEVAARVGAALHRLEANPPATQKVSNGPVT